MPPRIQSSILREVSQFSQCHKSIGQSSRSFSSTQHNDSRIRQSMWSWMNNMGQNLRDPLPNSTNYLGAYDRDGNHVRSSKEADGAPARETVSDLRPFPLNKYFQSEPVLSEEFREVIWAKIMKDGMSVKEVSAQLGVEMRRVGAVVRLKEVEKAWISSGKKLCRPYAKAVMSMLPKTEFDASPSPRSHEHINELPVHAATMQQIFYPTSESRHFTRKDAAKIFDEKLLPADDRVPHPELTEMAKDQMNGFNAEERAQRAKARSEEALAKKLASQQRRANLEANAVKHVQSGPRWDFRFREISIDDAGPTGRGAKGTGWRYGVPHMDRKRGDVKIPTRVQ